MNVHLMYLVYLEWTFAKQKWQRQRKVVGDKAHETAQILPGYNEKVYA